VFHFDNGIKMLYRTGYLFNITGWLTRHMSTNETRQGTGFGQANFLATLTKPLTSKLIQVGEDNR
jgi:hypothetical protein